MEKLTTVKKFWLGDAPTRCDLCGSAVEKEFYDVATVLGVWGTLDHDCFTRYGIGLGTGRGQKYAKQEDGRFLKVGG